MDGIVECEPASLHTGINSSDSTYETQITATSRNMRVLLKQKRWQQLVLQQLNDLGWHLIRKVSIDFTEVSIDVRDVADTSATLVLKLSADYPLKWPEIEAGSLMVAPNYFAAHHTFRLADIRKEYLKGMVYYAPILQVRYLWLIMLFDDFGLNPLYVCILDVLTSSSCAILTITPYAPHTPRLAQQTALQRPPCLSVVEMYRRRPSSRSAPREKCLCSIRTCMP